MSEKTNIYLYPATRSNEITKEYYDFLIGEVNRGVTNHRVCVIDRKNGTYQYQTYHLISVR